MNMKEMIRSMPYQINHQSKNLQDLSFDKNKFKDIGHIVIAGMGGSAISGDFSKLMLKDSIDIPIYVVRDYTLPKWCNNSTLFILSSYSGNTEETLSIYKQAKEKSDKIISITTGGTLESNSIADQIDVVNLPKGYQPRAAIGFSLFTLMVVLKKIDLIKQEVIESILVASEELKSFYNDFCEVNGYAFKIANKIRDGVVSIYGVESSTDVIASRFRAQLAENAKILTSHHSLPELNHNEIEGWNSNQFVGLNKHIIWIQDIEDHKQVKNRIEITSELLSELDVENIFIIVDGENRISRLIKLIYLTDWISYYVAEINGVDPIPVNRIESLKKRMPKLDL